MNDPRGHPIDEAFAAARNLPEPVQEALAAEIMARIDQLGRSSLNHQQRAEIKVRLSTPPVYTDVAAVEAFFKRHGAET